MHRWIRPTTYCGCLLYDNWANKQILLSLQDNLEAIDEADQAVKYFAHIAGAQELWYLRAEGKVQDDLAVWPDYDLTVALQKITTLYEKWQQLIQSNRSYLDRTISYTNSKGTPFDTPLSDILHHVIIHGQHHRAQIAKLLRNAKIEPPATDFIYFSRSN
ncbi:MAG: DinB family protein [Fodinibius sp.]|nr:DinB family protein [Fodinibius sp.]